MLFCCAAIGVSHSLVGCNQSNPDDAFVSPTVRLSRSDNKSDNKKVEQDWNRTLEAWSKAWEKSQSTPQPTQSRVAALPTVRINIRAIASRHPAWKLAAALEQNQVGALDYATIRAIGLNPESLRTPTFDVNFKQDSVAVPENESTPATPLPDYERPTQTVMAAGLEALENEASDRQSDAMEQFLHAVAARQTDAEEEYALIRRAEIETAFETAREAPLPETQPFVFSPDEQLQMTNLQLQLLRNVFTTDEERQTARDQLNKLLADWRARLRRQEQERASTLQRLRVEEPRRAREAGEAALRRDLEALRVAQQHAREVLWQQHRLRLQQDFGEDEARLGIVLPAASLASPEPGTAPKPAFDLIETNFTLPSSQAVFSRSTLSGAIVRQPISATAPLQDATASSSGARRIVVRALRAQAWREAKKQAQLAARHFGWQWPASPSSSTKAPDQTQQVLQWLFS